jgi:hypothetical protein
LRDLKHLYVIIQDEEVIDFSTNLSAFCRLLKLNKFIGSQIKSEPTMKRYFNKNKKLTYLGSNKKIYTLQKVL